MMTRKPCAIQLAHDLGVLNLRGNVISGCGRGGSCFFEHLQVDKLSKQELYRVIDSLAQPREGKEPIMREDMVKEAWKAIEARA